MALSDEQRGRIYEEEKAREKAKGSGRKILRWLGIGCLGVVLLLVALVVIACESGPDRETLTAGIGDPVVSANWSVTVPAAPTRVKVLSGAFSEQEAAGIFVIVPITIENIGDEGSTFSDWLVKLHDIRDREFDAASFSIQQAADGGLLLEPINPGLSKTTVVVFDIPEDAGGLVLEIKGALFSKSGFIDIEDLN